MAVTLYRHTHFGVYAELRTAFTYFDSTVTYRTYSIIGHTSDDDDDHDDDKIILMCVRKLMDASLIYRTEPKIKKRK